MTPLLMGFWPENNNIGRDYLAIPRYLMCCSPQFDVLASVLGHLRQHWG